MLTTEDAATELLVLVPKIEGPLTREVAKQAANRDAVAMIQFGVMDATRYAAFGWFELAAEAAWLAIAGARKHRYANHGWAEYYASPCDSTS